MQKQAGRELLAAVATGNVLFSALTVFPASAGDLSAENRMLKERLRLLEAKVDALLSAERLFENSVCGGFPFRCKYDSHFGCGHASSGAGLPGSRERPNVIRLI